MKLSKKQEQDVVEITATLIKLQQEYPQNKIDKLELQIGRIPEEMR